MVAEIGLARCPAKGAGGVQVHGGRAIGQRIGQGPALFVTGIESKDIGLVFKHRRVGAPRDNRYVVEGGDLDRERLGGAAPVAVGDQ